MTLRCGLLFSAGGEGADEEEDDDDDDANSSISMVSVAGDNLLRLFG